MTKNRKRALYRWEGENTMSGQDTLPSLIRVMLASCLVLTLLAVAGCGRKGALEEPPVSRPSSPQSDQSSTDQPAGEQPVEDRPFILDPLI